MNLQTLSTLILTSTLFAAAGAAAAPAAQTVDEGEYLVTVTKRLSCQSHELNLTKELKFNLGTNELPEAIVHPAGAVGDNLMHPMFCMQTPPPSAGTILIDVKQTTKLEAADGLTIQSIRKVTETAAAPVLLAPAAYGKGEYLYSLQGQGSCRNAEVNVKKTLVYTPAQPVTIELASNGIVLDDLIRPEICMIPADVSAVTYVQVGTDAVVKGVGADQLTLTGARKVTHTLAITLQ